MHRWERSNSARLLVYKLARANRLTIPSILAARLLKLTPHKTSPLKLKPIPVTPHPFNSPRPLVHPTPTMLHQNTILRAAPTPPKVTSNPPSLTGLIQNLQRHLQRLIAILPSQASMSRSSTLRTRLRTSRQLQSLAKLHHSFPQPPVQKTAHKHPSPC